MDMGSGIADEDFWRIKGHVLSIRYLVISEFSEFFLYSIFPSLLDFNIFWMSIPVNMSVFAIVNNLGQLWVIYGEEFDFLTTGEPGEPKSLEKWQK